MEVRRERPPEYVLHDPNELRLPSVPQHEVGSPPHRPADLTLPGLKSVLAGLPPPRQTAIAYDNKDNTFNLHPDRLASLERQGLGVNLPSLTSPALVSRTLPVRAGSDATLKSPTETGSIMSVDDTAQRNSRNLSLEDPDVRAAAEALSGLGNPEFTRFSHLSQDSIGKSTELTKAPVNGTKDADEPILSLLVETHPWVGGTINGSLSAYQTTKHFTPRFVQNGATFIERSVVNTVGAIGHHTGVESGLRNYLGNRRISDAERRKGVDKQKKRTRDEADGVTTTPEDVFIEDIFARARIEFLPAYRHSKPPSYREEASPDDVERGARRPQQPRSWSNRFLLSTSGLGVALSDGSLKSLTYCTGLLSKGANHVELVLNALKLVLQDYESERLRQDGSQSRHEKEVEAGVAFKEPMHPKDATRDLATRIENLCAEIWKTLQTVVDQLAKYAGAALPINARQLVKAQILSIPSRWRWASEQADAQSVDSPSRTAHRMIAFASEGLDVMSQVNGIMQHTLQSAEDWLKTFGRYHGPQLVPAEPVAFGSGETRSSPSMASTTADTTAGAEAVVGSQEFLGR